MDVSAVLYTLLLSAVGLERLLELRISYRRQHELASRGIMKVPEQRFHWMVLLHAGVLLGAGLEVWLLKRPFTAALSLPMGFIFLVATALRWWVIRTMAEHWNVQVMNSISLGVVTTGPFRWIRHPNYLAVMLELGALPLVHGAWVTAVVASLANCWVLSQRLAIEEAVLFTHPAYRAVFGQKPRFVPLIFRRWRML